MFVYALPVALSYAVSGLFFTQLFYNGDIQIIGTVIIALLVTQFPVLLS